MEAQEREVLNKKLNDLMKEAADLKARLIAEDALDELWYVASGRMVSHPMPKQDAIEAAEYFNKVDRERGMKGDRHKAMPCSKPLLA
jgi:hypothetical protein